MGALFAFSPWVYSKVVAGHLMMVFALASCFGLICYLQRRKRSRLVVSILTAFACTQLQFGVLLLITTLITGFVVKRVRVVAVTAAIFLLPAFVGILSEYGWLSSIPLLTAWDRNNSVPLFSGVALMGYAADYIKAWPLWLTYFCYLFPAIASYGAVKEFRAGRRWPMVGLLCAIVILILSSGDGWPLGPLYDKMIMEIHWLGLFRELYDLIGLVLVSYLLIFLFTRKDKIIFLLLALLAGVQIWAWLVAPPSHYWVQVRERVDLSVVPRNSRFVLIPFNQPVRYLGRGSGSDPDLIFENTDGVAPLNSYDALYPGDVAVSNYEEKGSINELRELSVGTIFTRSYVKSNWEALRFQRIEESRPPNRRTAVILLNGVRPLITFSENSPSITNQVRQMGGDAIFITNACRAHLYIGEKLTCRYDIPKGSKRTFDPKRAWVNLGFVEEAMPAVGQAVGGVFTMQSHRGIQAAYGYALMWIKGEIVGAGKKVVARGDGRAYHWHAVIDGTKLYCRGACAIALFDAMPYITAATPRRANDHELPMRTMAPWLLQIVTMRGALVRYVRFNTRFDHWWMLFGAGHVQHVEVGPRANGWIVERADNSGHAYIIEVVAALQAALELLVSLVLLGFLLRIVHSRVKKYYEKVARTGSIGSR